MPVYDFSMEDKALYTPDPEPVLVTIPAMRFLMVDGTGAPDGEAYQKAIELLYSAGYTVKMSQMETFHPERYFDFVVPALECLWGLSDGSFTSDRNQWTWTAILRVPEFVTPEVFTWACGELRDTKGLDTSAMRLDTLEEGLCVQATHIGPYTTEEDTITRLSAFIREQGLTDLCGDGVRHHEIYLSDPRNTAPEELKTILRHPVRK